MFHTKFYKFLDHKICTHLNLFSYKNGGIMPIYQKTKIYKDQQALSLQNMTCQKGKIFKKENNPWFRYKLKE